MQQNTNNEMEARLGSTHIFMDHFKYLLETCSLLVKFQWELASGFC